MDVSIISGTFPQLKCGVGDYTYWLCSELKKYDVKLNVITSQNPQLVSLNGICITPLLERWSFCGLPVLLSFLKKNIADIVHLQYPTQSYKNKAMINIFPVFLKMMLPKTLFIVTLHDMATAHILNKLRILPFLFFADAIIVTACEEKEYLIKRFPFLEPKIKIIFIASSIKPHSVSTEEKEKIREEIGVGEEEILLSHFGYILPKKGLEVLLEALKRLKQDGYRAKLIFVSDFFPQKDSYHRRLKNLAKKLGLSDSIIWAGYCTEQQVSRYLSSADIGIQAYPDGVSFRRSSFLAALAHGLAIVTTIDKKLPQGLKDHENILAVPAKNTDKFVGAIKELIDSRQLRVRLAGNAKLFSQAFSWENVAKEHFELYKSLLKK